MYTQQVTPQGWHKTSNLNFTPFWLDADSRPHAEPDLVGESTADLLVVGGGFTGLWAAVESAIQNPDKRIVLCEAARIADGASGRNGGFVSASLTHGFSNGLNRWPQEIGQLEKLGRQNLADIGARIAEFAIDCDWITSGDISVATESYQTQNLVNLHNQLQHRGISSQLLDSREVRERVNSPLYIAGLFQPDVAMVNPAQLAWGLARVAKSLGVQIWENSPVTGLKDLGSKVTVITPNGQVTARHVLLATNAYAPLVRTVRRYVVPVYDYVLVTAPLTHEERLSINWEGREGIADSGNQFHYYRMTQDNRILFGGFDAIYHRKNGMSSDFDVDLECLARLADHFVQIFPQLKSVEFTHGWGGAIDTSSRFSAFWGLTHRGKTAYVAGFTGLGVGASRFGALACLDLLDGRRTERTALSMVKTKPLPFPPEPLRSLGIEWTVKSLRKADRLEGKRNLWLKVLDRCGLGFDS